MTKIKPELLAPAGNLDILKIAFLYGADAVYCGTPDFAMRSRVGFTLETLKEGIDYAHSLEKKVFITLNAFPHSSDIDSMLVHIKKIVDLQPDALIVADPGIVKFIRDNFDIDIHLSTQANTTNELSVNFWADQGVSRVVLAREMSIPDIKKIHKYSKISIETFVHGAMCMAHSGRCQISNYLSGRDPNQGKCVQACRFKYKMYALEEDLREGEYFPIYEDEEGTHILNSKDLCMIDHIDDLIKAGVSSFKIEGRLKSEYYVATVVRAYRNGIDLYLKNPIRYEAEKKSLFAEVQKSTNRGFTTGFYYNNPTKADNNYLTSKAKSSWGYIGRVLKYDKAVQKLSFEAKNYLPVGSDSEIITPTNIYPTRLNEMIVDGKESKIAHAGNIVETTFVHELPVNSLIRINLDSMPLLDKKSKKC